MLRILGSKKHPALILTFVIHQQLWDDFISGSFRETSLVEAGPGIPVQSFQDLHGSASHSSAWH